MALGYLNACSNDAQALFETTNAIYRMACEQLQRELLCTETSYEQ